MSNTFVMEFDENEDVINKLVEYMKQNKVTELVLIKAEGKIREPEVITHGKSGSVRNEKLAGDCEINAISGSILKSKNYYDPQINIAVTQTGVNTKIGHLAKAKAGTGLQLSVRKIDLSKMIT